MTNANIDVIRELIAASGLDAPSIEEQRAGMDRTAGSVPAPSGVTVEPTTMGGRPAEWITPTESSSDHVVLYLHGGGYCIGSISSHRSLAGRLALAHGGRVLTLEYRLGPEHPFPAALDDAVAAYAELLASGLASSSIAVAGDSAGGGLTVATLLAAARASMPVPGAAVCLSPWLDLTQTAATYATRGDADPMVTKDGLDLMAAAYLAGGPADDPLASPLFADPTELAGLPPLLVQVGDAEVLLDDSVSFCRSAVGAGADVTLDVWDDMIHVFQAFPAELLPESDESLTKVGAFLRAHLS